MLLASKDKHVVKPLQTAVQNVLRFIGWNSDRRIDTAIREPLPGAAPLPAVRNLSAG